MIRNMNENCDDLFIIHRTLCKNEIITISMNEPNTQCQCFSDLRSDPNKLVTNIDVTIKTENIKYAVTFQHLT